MAENDDPTPGPGEPAAEPAEPTVEQTAVTSEAAAAEPKPKFTDRLWNFRAMAAVALAALLLGGGIGAAITAASHDDGPDRRMLRIGPGGPDLMRGGPGMPGVDPQQRQKFREELKDMRKEFRDRMKQQFDEDKNAPKPPTPTSTPTPNG